MKLRVDEESLCVRMSLEEATLLMEQGHLSQRLPALGNGARCRVELTANETTDLELITHAADVHAITLRASRDRLSSILRSIMAAEVRTKDAFGMRSAGGEGDHPLELRLEVDLFSVRDAQRSREPRGQSTNLTLG